MFWNRKLPKTTGEVNIDGVKYLYKLDNQYDYLMDISNNEVKIHLTFTKDQEKRNEAKNASKTLFSELF